MWGSGLLQLSMSRHPNQKPLSSLHEELIRAKRLDQVCALYWSPCYAEDLIRITVWTTQCMSQEVRDNLCKYISNQYSHGIYNLSVVVNKITFYIEARDIVRWNFGPLGQDLNIPTKF
jgi:hypothetical protein